MEPGLTANGSFIRNITATAPVEESRCAPIGGRSKRAFDILIAATAILVLLPIMLVVALMVWFQDRGAPLFSHSRLGYDGRTFRCFKFRSMARDSSEILAALIKSDPGAAREWAETQKLRSDPRVTPIGHILRLSSLDELPQFFNVLKGEMSIVGPRPIVAAEIERYGNEYEHYRACRPGLTGLWQVSGRNDCSYAERVRCDVLYARCWSFRRDVHIVLQTIPVVLTRKGSC